MAKRRKYKSSKSSKCPEPLNTLIDIAGAAALGAYTRHKILKDYERGQGEASVKAAMLVHGAGAMRRGSDGLVSLGGVYGINSALKALEKKERAAVEKASYSYSEPLTEPLRRPHTNNNKYAWRMNCEDGAAFGVNPENYETRLEYHEALRQAKADVGVERPTNGGKSTTDSSENSITVVDHSQSTVVYRISRLDSGANQFFISHNKGITVGTRVLIHLDAEKIPGIVLSIHTPEDPSVPNSGLIMVEIECQ